MASPSILKVTDCYSFIWPDIVSFWLGTIVDIIGYNNERHWVCSFESIFVMGTANSQFLYAMKISIVHGRLTCFYWWLRQGRQNSPSLCTRHSMGFSGTPDKWAEVCIPWVSLRNTQNNPSEQIHPWQPTQTNKGPTKENLGKWSPVEETWSGLT